MNLTINNCDSLGDEPEYTERLRTTGTKVSIRMLDSCTITSKDLNILNKYF